MVHHFPIFSHIFPMKMVVLWIVGLSMFGAKVSISTAIWSRASPTPGRVMGQRNPAPVENGRESPTGWWWLEHGLIFPYNVGVDIIGNVIIPTDELIYIYIFQRGGSKPPTSLWFWMGFNMFQPSEIGGAGFRWPTSFWDENDVGKPKRWWFLFVSASFPGFKLYLFVSGFSEDDFC